MLRIVAAAVLLSLPVAAVAQSKPAATAAAEKNDPGQPPQRVRNVTIAPGEKCPESSGNEVVVCGTLTEPYRIPKPLRNPPRVDAASQSWVNRVATIDDVGRRAGGLPNTCSPVGSGGQTGCTTQMLQQYAAEKAEKKREDSTVP